MIPIPHRPGFFIDEEGRVYRLRELARVRNNGHWVVALDGKKFRVSKLMQETFFPHLHTDLFPKDGDPDNLRLANLSPWRTAASSMPAGAAAPPPSPAEALLREGYSREDVAEALCIPLSEVPEVL